MFSTGRSTRPIAPHFRTTVEEANHRNKGETEWTLELVQRIEYLENGCRILGFNLECWEILKERIEVESKY